MSEDDITLLDKVLIERTRRGDLYGRLYYYQGNFYQPLKVHGGAIAHVRRATRRFLREQAERVRADRAHPDYRTPVQLMDEQEAACA